MATARQTEEAPQATPATEEVVNTVVDEKASVAPRRYFTTPGRDPFDEVEWEIRDAHIPGKNGPAFEQRGVEFPKFWSQTATNIVAQKYFRGRLASPERERSVKQMIGRVVSTIGAWGREGGYFASEEEAETFEAELKAILVNQYASFNSPVWFNVGFEARPQCSACQPWGALVSTPDGMVPIGQLVEEEQVGREVYDANGSTRIVAVQANGLKEVFRVTLRNGSFIEATGDHVVKAAHARRTPAVWLRVDELRPGMRMHLYPHRAKVAERVPVVAGAGRLEEDPFVAPDDSSRLAAAEAALAGWLQADGFVGQYEEGTNRSLTIEFQVANDDEYDWVVSNLDLVFPDVHRHVRDVGTRDPSLTCRRIRLYGEELRDFVDRWQLLLRGTAMRVPERLWTASHEEITAYLRSVFQADGYVTVRRDNGTESGRVAFAVIGERWAEEIQILLNVVGIYSRRTRKVETRENRHDLHEVAISIGSERARFAELIGFVGQDKQQRLLESLTLRDPKTCPDLREEEIVSIESLGVQDVYDIQTESGEYLTNNIAVHNCFILSIEDSMESILDWIRREGIIFRGGSGSGVNLSRLRSSKEQLSKGGYASGPVSFMRGADASAGTIKSGGKCFREGTLVATPEGWRPIEQLRVGELVLTHKGPRAVADFMPNGRKQCYRVRTREGYEVEVTEGHKFAYWNGAEGGFDVKRIEDFRPGDALYALLTPSEGGTTIPLLAPDVADPANATRVAEMQLPTELDERFAYVLGLTYGDGELRTTYPYRLRVAFCKDEAGRISADRFRAYSRDLFGEEPALLGDEEGHQQLGFTRKRLIELLVANGIAKGKGDALGFPSILFRATPAVRAAFVAGVIDADGTYQRRGGWAISSIDRAFLVDLQRLLLTLGVPSKLELSRRRRGTWRPLYRLCVVGHTFADRLAGLIAPHSAKVEVAYRPSAGADKGWGYRPSLYDPLVARVERRGGYRLVERSVGLNETSGYRAVATLAAHPDAAVAEYAEEVSTCVQLTLETVTPTEVAQTYDIEVEDVHLLSANGLYASNTRRAAKMVILDVDHPDVEEFIWCKAREERKARVLEAAGYDMSLDSPDWASIQYQNANNSVRVTDAFMEAVLEGKEWNLTARTDGSVVETKNARELLRQIAEAAWECADPGVQYDTTINAWHTCPNSGRINASNPCFPGDARVHTTLGLLRFEELYELAQAGEEFRVYTHRATAEQPGTGVVASLPVAVMRNGVKPILRLRFANGQELRCTANHRLWTTNRGWVEAGQLTEEDRVLLNDSPTPASDAAWTLPVKIEALAGSFSRGGTVARTALPERWSEGLGELLGHLVGDGWLTDVQTGWVYGGDDVADGLAASHEGMLRELVGGISRQRMENGTVQLRAGSRAVRDFFRGLGVASVRAHEKRVPASVFTAPPEVQAAFLRGLFGADGCVSRSENGKASRYVGLGSRSEALLKDVQRLLAAFGVRSRIYAVAGSDTARFSYARSDGTEVEYASRQGFDLRITGTDLESFAAAIGFSSPRKQRALETLLAETERYRTAPDTTLVSREEDGQEVVYNLTEPLHHSYIVDGLVVANCSEYMHLDDSACNLASLNLMKFRREDGEFDVEAFEHAVDVVFLAQEIIVGYSSYPTPEIERNAKAYRQLGLGYANLGALLMARGLPYDSDEGRAYAAAITALMTGRAYRKSAEIARRMGPFAGYRPNAAAMLGVIAKHRAAVGNIDHSHSVPDDLLAAARRAWDEALELGEVAGFRNAQATVLAPTGCLVGDSLVSTSRGLVRLRSLGDPVGDRWQDLDVQVATDEGPRQATQFYVNGFEQVVSIETSRGYRIQGTPTHRIKVVDADGNWEWRRFAEIREGDRVPLMLGGLVGEPQTVELPPLGDLRWTADFRARVPREMTPELAELVGYFMGDGSLHAKGLRFCVAREDGDVVEHLVDAIAALFGLEASVTEKDGYTEVAVNSVPLVLWWEACGFAKLPPSAEHSGKGWHSHIPDAILHTNDRDVYAAFVRGLFEADGTTTNGYVSWSTVTESFSRDVQTMLLALGFVTTRKVDLPSTSWGANDRFVLRLLNVAASERYLEEIDFISARKAATLRTGSHRQAARHDHVPVGRELIDELAPENDSLRRTTLMSLARRGDVSRRAATALLEGSADPELEHLLGFYYDTVATVETLDDQPTYDISVPDNVTYVANGFVSHNTISFMMDCDTTGVEPDFSLVKSKKLVGGGEITIVNKTVPMALEKLGYTPSEVEEIVAYIDERNTIVGAPYVKTEHYPVFDCAIGERAIHYMGHVKMMGAVQPFISGALSKTVNLPEETTVEEISQLFVEAWQLGVKAIAIYRDNCKVAQPLAKKGEAAITLAPGGGQVVVSPLPQRRRLPDDRVEVGRKFKVGEYEGYIHVGLFEDGTPGDIFVDIAKEGTTLAGLMNSFMISVSLGLQYGVPLEVYVSKFSHMRFEPSGLTNDPDIRVAKSIVDYIFRWMGKKFLSPDQQEEAGILTPEVKARLAAAYADAGEEAASAVAAIAEAPPPGQTALFNQWEDAIECSRCGGRMVRTGSCYTCRDCGTNTGCS